jgi:hypothetical protein
VKIDELSLFKVNEENLSPCSSQYNIQTLNESFTQYSDENSKKIPNMKEFIS